MASENAAKLRIDADAADVNSVFASIVARAAGANAKMLSSSRAAATEQKKTLRELSREYAALASTVKRVADAHERVVTAKERRITAITRSEQRTRERDADAAVGREAIRAARIQAIRAESEARVTRTHERAMRERMAAEDRLARRGGGAGGGRAAGGAYRSRFGQTTFDVGGAARGFARDMHGQVQGARETRARTETNLNDAFVQAIGSGLDANEAQSLRAQVLQFARAHSIREEDIAPAINEAQTRFAVISGTGNEGMTREQRMGARRQAVTNLLESTRLARLSGNDTTETARFYGAMTSRGMDANTALAATRQAIAAGFAGSVSLGEVSSQALGSLSQSTAAAQAGATDPAERSRIARENVARFFANLQMQAAVGARAGASGNRLMGLESFSENTARTDVLYRRLRENFRGNEGATTELNSMFKADGTGRYRVSEDARDPTVFTSRMAGMFGGDINAFRNVMGARGTWSAEAGGRNQVMTAPLVGALANAMAVGPDVLAQRNRIMSSDLDENTLRTMGEIRASEDTTTLVRSQQENRDALRDNSRLIVQLSDRFANWSSSNPFTTSAFTALGGAFGGGFLARAGTFQWGGQAAQTGMSALGGGSGVVSGGAGAMGAGAIAVTVVGIAAVAAASLAAVMMANEQINAETGTTAMQRITDPEGAYSAYERTRRAQDTARTEAFSLGGRSRRAGIVESLGGAPTAGPLQIGAGAPRLNLSDESINRMAVAWAGAGIQLRLDPHDAAHVASAANASGGATP